MSHDLQLFSLGGLTLSVTGQIIGDQIPLKAKALMVYVLRQRQPQPREKLASLLWSDFATPRAAHNQRQALMPVRELLSAWVDVRRTEIAVTGELDANVLEDTSDRFRPVLRGDRPFSPADIDTLTQNLMLYRGDFFAHIDLPEASAFEEWASTEREALRQRFISAGSAFLPVLTTTRHYEDGIELALRLLAADSLHEGTHRQLMTLYAVSGDRTSALQTFERLQTLLWDELGVEPDDETIGLYERIAAHQVDILPAAPLIVQNNASSPTNLPGEMTPFLGREQTLAQIHQLMTTTRWLTLIGPGGLGKTRLGLKAAQQHRSAFRDGVFWVELAPLVTAHGVGEAVRLALGLEDSGEGKLQDLLLEFLRQKQLLLLFDNFEHVLDAADLVNVLLRGAPELKVLVTSRERLGFYGETVYEVPPLLRAESMALFLERAQAVHPRFEVTEPAALDALCARLDDMPLALELAASHAGHQNLVEMLHGLDAARLGTTLRGLPERQRTLFNAIEWSYQLLTPAEQALYRRLAYFVGSWSADDAAWCGPLNDLENLAEKSLIRRIEDGQTVRYSMLETIRQHARVKLTEAGEHPAVLDRYLNYYVDFAETANLGLRGPEEAFWNIRLHAALDNLHAALEYSHEAGEILIEARLAAALGRFWYFASLPRDAYSFSERVLHQRDQLPPELAAGVLATLGHGAYSLGEFDYAKQCHVEALDLYERTADIHGEAYMSLCMGAHVTDLQQRLTFCQHSYDLFKQVEELSLFSGICNNLSLIYSSQGDFTAAERVIQEGLARARGLDLITESMLYNSWGSVLIAQGRLGEALSVLEDYFTLENRIPFMDSSSLADRSMLMLMQGRTDEAAAIWNEAAQNFEQLNYRPVYQRVFSVGMMIAGWQENTAVFRQRCYTTFDNLTVSALTHTELVDLSYGLAYLVWHFARKGGYAEAQQLRAGLEEMLSPAGIVLSYPHYFYLDKAAPLLANTPPPSPDLIPDNPFVYALECAERLTGSD